MLSKRLGLEDKELVKQCDKLFLKFLDSEGKYDYNYQKRENINSFLGDLEDENNVLLTVIKNDKVVAFLYGYIESKKGMKEPVAHLTFIYVDNDYRKQNIATNLIEEYLRILKVNNIQIVEVKSYKDNSVANSLYNKFGFKELWTNYRKIL